MPDTLPPPGWYHDPTAPGDGRYWDGTTWTNSASRDGVTMQVPIDPAVAVVPPVPGSEMRLPTPYAAPTVSVTTSNRSPAAVIVGLVVVALLIVLVFAVVNNNSSNDTPTPTNEPPAEAPPTEAPPAEAPPATEGG